MIRGARLLFRFGYLIFQLFYFTNGFPLRVEATFYSSVRVSGRCRLIDNCRRIRVYQSVQHTRSGVRTIFSRTIIIIIIHNRTMTLRRDFFYFLSALRMILIFTIILEFDSRWGGEGGVSHFSKTTCYHAYY